MCGLCKVVGLIAIIGALNWGMIAVMNMNVVAMIFGDGTMASRVVYGLVGVSGLMLLFSYVKVCPACKKKMSGG
jgi:hypothetical protein